MNFLSNDNFDSESLLTDDGYKIIEEEEKFSNLPNTINSEQVKERQEIKLEMRNYQYQLFQKSKQGNSIVVLETGTGKTMIAIYLIYYHLCTHNLTKKIAFITNTVQLCEQQYDQILKKLPFAAEILREEHQKIDLNQVKFEILHGDKYVDMWSGAKWKEVLLESNVFCLTSQVFLNCLRRGYLKFYEFSLIVLDECHHANGEHPYNNIMKEFYFYYKNLNDQKITIPIIFGLTASPFLTLNKGKKKQETFDIKDIEENLILLCKNLDSNFLGYDPAEVRMFLKEAQTSIKVFSNDKFIENCNGECFLKYLEDFNQENGTFETIIVQERLIAKFYLDFTNIILGTSRNNESLSKNFKEIVEEIDHYLRKKTLRILHELGMVAFSFLIEDIKNSLEDLEKQILIDGKDQDIKGYKKLKSMFSSFYAYLKEKLNLRINIVSKNSNKFQKLIEIINEKEQSEENQMTVLIFVNKRMLAKYMNKLLSLYFNERVGYIVGQSKVADNKGEKSLLLEKEVSNLIKKSQINSIFEKNLDGLNQNLYNNKKTSKMKHYFENKYSLKQQLSVIKQFRDKSIDFLISTSVTEEGFDVPNCNLVIAYNDVKTIRSFIQLKGRARKENSEFLIFSPALLMDNLKNKKDDYEILSIKMKEHINQLAALPKHEILNREISLKLAQSNKFYEVTIIESSGAFLNSNWARELLQHYCSFLKKNDKIKNKCLEFFLKISPTQMASQSFICIIILPPNAQKQMFFYDKSSFSSKDEAKKASYYYAVLELNKAGCFTKNLKPCNVDLMRINLEDEDDENIEKDFVYKENFKKYVKSISRRDNESSKPHTIHFYPRINEEVFKFNYMKDNLFYEANEWNFYLYSIEISMEDFEIENKNKSKNKLGLIYFSDILKDFSRTLCEKNHNQIGYFSLKLITKSINLKETFERLYKVYQFLEITKKSWTYKYISSFIASKNQEIKTNMSFKLKQMESSLLFVILKEDNTIDWNKYDEIDKHIEILTKFHEREQISLDTKKNCQNHDNSNLNNEKFEINSIITNIKSCCNGIIKDIIKNKPDGNNLKNSSFSQAQEISIIIEGLKKSMSFENSSTLSYQKTNIQGFIIFPLDYLFMKNFFTIMNNLYAIRDFLLSLVFKEVLQRMEENRKQFCQVSERKKTWDFSFWAINHEKFCNFLTEKYPYILKLKKNTKKFQTSFNPNFDNTQIDQSFEKKNYLFSDNISSKITLTELMIKTIDYDCLDNNSPFIEIGGSIINFLVTISCFLKKKKKDNYKDYAEMVSERSKYKYNTFSHHVIVSKQFYQYLLNKHLPLPVTTLVNNSKKNNHSYLPCQYIEATRKEHTDFLRGLIGIYYHTFDKDIMVCQKILWELEIVDSPGYRIIQEGKFILDKNSKLYGHFKTLLEYYEFKNHGLLIQAFSSRNLMQKINEFFLKDKGLQDDMSFLIKAFDYSGDKSKDDTIVSEIYKLKEAEKIVNSIEANNFLNERFVFLGEGLIEFLIHEHLLESYNEKDSTYCGAILIDSNFLINCAKREIMGILEILIKDVITEENMKINPWFHYDLIVTENQIKEIGFKKVINYKQEIIYTFSFRDIQNGDILTYDIIAENEENARNELIRTFLEKYGKK